MPNDSYEWRKIWQDAIDTCQKTIKFNCQNGKFFTQLRNFTAPNGTKPFENDRMVDFEEGIAYECLKQYNKAIQIYEKVSNEDGGLPVKHWRNRANIFLQRAQRKANKCPEFPDIGDALKPEVQWNAFYYLHSFAYIPHHIIYMAISSMSRIDSEPAMAIAVFRLCLEEIIRHIYPSEYKQIVELEKRNFSVLMEDIYGTGPLLSDDIESAKTKAEWCKEIILRGNAAIHGNDRGIIIDYTPEYREETITYFIRFMQIANMTIKKLEKEKKLI